MKAKVKFTITKVMELDSDVYGIKVKTKEDFREFIKEYIKQDSSFVLDSLDNCIIETEIIMEIAGE